MKTLFLSSAGVRFPIVKEEFLKILPKKPSELNVVFINTASRVVTDNNFAKEDEQALRDMGFAVHVLDIAGKSEDELREEFKDKDIIFVEGGNTFYLLKHVKESGFGIVVRELIERGTIYFGVSAGTYIACPTIEMALWKREVDERYGLANMNAMNLVPFLISVHYNREKYREVLKAGISKTTFPVKILTDDQSLLVKDDVVTLVGKGDEVTI
jgi:dipeptidase E